jgi:DNA-binding transcriptional regulator/RsmH inhibitor MraZ
MGVERVFITTVDMKVIRIYINSVWEHNENIFASAGEDAEIAEDVSFIANLYGANADIDKQGRVLIPSEIRKELDIEGETLWMNFYNGRINAFGKKVYEERMQRAKVNLSEKVKHLETKGFK